MHPAEVHTMAIYSWCRWKTALTSKHPVSFSAGRSCGEDHSMLSPCSLCYRSMLRSYLVYSNLGWEVKPIMGKITKFFEERDSRRLDRHNGKFSEIFWGAILRIFYFIMGVLYPYSYILIYLYTLFVTEWLIII